MQFPVVVKRIQDNHFNIAVPDLPGCESVGNSTEQALQNAADAIETHLDSMTQHGDPIPTPSRIEDHQKDPQFTGGIWALVTVDVSRHLGKSKRINITIPERLLKQIDKYTSSHGGNRSAFLAEAALNYISRHHYRRGSDYKTNFDKS